MRRQLVPAIVMLAVFTVITGTFYPLAVTGTAQLLLHDKANGSLIDRDGQIVGSVQVGQQFTRARYFHPRPSSAGAGYDASQSSASNLGPTNETLLAAVAARVDAYRHDNNLPPGTPVPVDAVTGSASGLDPAISVANAGLQAARVAHARDVPVKWVRELIKENTDRRGLGVLGEPAVNVLELNLALDRL